MGLLNILCAVLKVRQVCQVVGWALAICVWSEQFYEETFELLVSHAIFIVRTSPGNRPSSNINYFYISIFAFMVFRRQRHISRWRVPRRTMWFSGNNGSTYFLNWQCFNTFTKGAYCSEYSAINLSSLSWKIYWNVV